MSTEREHMPDETRLRDLLIGRKVERVEMRDEAPPDTYYESGPTGRLHLSDGRVLRVWGNEGGCSCGAGDYPLARLAEFDNVITNVEVEAAPDGDDVPCRTCGKDYCFDHENPGFYRIHVFAGQEKTLLASFEGTDGNGYYGTGWWLSVAEDTAAPIDR